MASPRSALALRYLVLFMADVENASSQHPAMLPPTAFFGQRKELPPEGKTDLLIIDTSA